MGSRPTPSTTPLLELSRARAEAILRTDQSRDSQVAYLSVTEREEAARAKAKEVRERIEKRKAYGNGSRAASPARPRTSPHVSTDSSALCNITTSSGARPRHASPKPARAAAPQAKLQAKPDQDLAASLMLNGLFERRPLSDTSQHSSVSGPPPTTGWRCHALAETPRQVLLELPPATTTADPSATVQAALHSQHITALSDQIEALAASLREEQTARRSAEEKLKISQEQVRALLAGRTKGRAGSPLSGWDSK